MTRKIPLKNQIGRRRMLIRHEIRFRNMALAKGRQICEEFGVPWDTLVGRSSPMYLGPLRAHVMHALGEIEIDGCVISHTMVLEICHRLSYRALTKVPKWSLDEIKAGIEKWKFTQTAGYRPHAYRYGNPLPFFQARDLGEPYFSYYKFYVAERGIRAAESLRIVTLDKAKDERIKRRQEEQQREITPDAQGASGANP
jgi:hypothetical protein